ncbi:Thiol:disulfide interchange protein TlpA [Defluviimonas aquaemixtae]|uniref:Thiol:disulfide interchange protein TlpA n=1 Tax=Albidovulum aquaemixtae TaxID=1542388 RepID=A0A2R8BJ17_9RHOB|nr:TlpA disulfide reductase family protein [Defluviimonas aquaemixtae]SPH23367.1 Thiol:disulfide interchange protein TlpA [Defluviimonas aquaemixtae]
MRMFLSAVLYTALAFGANAALAGTVELEALREGSMKKLVFAAEPAPVPDTIFLDEAGTEHRLSDWQGKYLLVNFWATWCAPCRKELPALDALNRDFGGDTFAVLTIATGRNPVPAIRRLFSEVGVQGLPILLDPKQELSRGMGVFGLPVTVVLDRDGREIARLSGDAEWNGESARAIVAALLSGG